MSIQRRRRYSAHLRFLGSAEGVRRRVAGFDPTYERTTTAGRWPQLLGRHIKFATAAQGFRAAAFGHTAYNTSACRHTRSRAARTSNMASEASIAVSRSSCRAASAMAYAVNAIS